MPFLTRQEIGRRGEELAREYLSQLGHRLIDFNYHCPYGEIDIVSQDGDCLVFTEVRTRTTHGFGTPEESITPRKIEHLRLSTLHYQQNHPELPQECRIDVMAIELDSNGKIQRREIIKNAVSGS